MSRSVSLLALICACLSGFGEELSLEHILERTEKLPILEQKLYLCLGTDETSDQWSLSAKADAEALARRVYGRNNHPERKHTAEHLVSNGLTLIVEAIDSAAATDTEVAPYRLGVNRIRFICLVYIEYLEIIFRERSPSPLLPVVDLAVKALQAFQHADSESKLITTNSIRELLSLYARTELNDMAQGLDNNIKRIESRIETAAQDLGTQANTDAAIQQCAAYLKMQVARARSIGPTKLADELTQQAWKKHEDEFIKWFALEARGNSAALESLAKCTHTNADALPLFRRFKETIGGINILSNDADKTAFQELQGRLKEALYSGKIDELKGAVRPVIKDTWNRMVQVHQHTVDFDQNWKELQQLKQDANIERMRSAVTILRSATEKLRSCDDHIAKLRSDITSLANAKLQIPSAIEASKAVLRNQDMLNLASELLGGKSELLHDIQTIKMKFELSKEAVATLESSFERLKDSKSKLDEKLTAIKGSVRALGSLCTQLGIDSKVVNTVEKVVTTGLAVYETGKNLFNVVAGFASPNPLAALGAIGDLFGFGGPNYDQMILERLDRIEEKLDRMDKKLDLIIEMNYKILEVLGELSDTMVRQHGEVMNALSKLHDEVLFNRRLTLDVLGRDIHLSRSLLRALHSSSDFQTLSRRFSSTLDYLECDRMLRSVIEAHRIHSLLLARAYILELNGVADLDYNARVDPAFQYFKARFHDPSLASTVARALTEPQEEPYAWADANDLPDCGRAVAMRDFASVIDPEAIREFTETALSFGNLYFMVDYSRPERPTLLPPEERLTTRGVQNAEIGECRVRELLEGTLRLLDLAISQQALLSGYTLTGDAKTYALLDSGLLKKENDPDLAAKSEMSRALLHNRVLCENVLAAFIRYRLNKAQGEAPRGIGNPNVAVYLFASHYEHDSFLLKKIFGDQFDFLRLNNEWRLVLPVAGTAPAQKEIYSVPIPSLDSVLSERCNLSTTCKELVKLRTRVFERRVQLRARDSLTKHENRILTLLALVNGTSRGNQDETK